MRIIEMLILRLDLKSMISKIDTMVREFIVEITQYTGDITSFIKLLGIPKLKTIRADIYDTLFILYIIGIYNKKESSREEL